MTPQTLRAYHLRTAGLPIRTVDYNGRPHMVIPVIALRQGVIHAVNAPVPEYVSTEALQRAAHSWNGRALVIGHPVRDGRQVSANDPGVLAERGFGTIFESHVKNNRLSMEAWVDPTRLEALGQHALLESLRQGKQIEVSVGAFVRTLDRIGEHEGRAFKAEWRDIVGDHLAFLPGGTGACSIDMGCGAHRAAAQSGEGIVKMTKLRARLKTLVDGIRAAAFTVDGEEVEGEALNVEPVLPASDEQAEAIVYGTMREMMDQAQSSVDTASDLVDELIAAEENEGADEEAETEVETAQLESLCALCQSAASALMTAQGLAYRLMAKSATPDMPRYMEAKKEATVNGVLDQAKFRALIGKTISAATMKTIQAMYDHSHEAHDHAMGLGASCASGDMKAAAAKPSMEECPTCGGTGTKDGNTCPTCDGEGEIKAAEQHVDNDGGLSATNSGESTMNKEERTAAIKALASCECSGFKDDAKTLETLSDVRLEALQASTKAREGAQEALQASQERARVAEEGLTALKALQASKEPQAQPKPLTVEEFMAVAPAELKTLIETKKADDAAAHGKLVSQLKAAQAAYSEDELKALELPHLRKLASALKLDTPQADFSGVGVPRVASQPVDASVPPNPWEAGIKALRERERTH